MDFGLIGKYRQFACDQIGPTSSMFLLHRCYYSSVNRKMSVIYKFDKKRAKKFLDAADQVQIELRKLSELASKDSLAGAPFFLISEEAIKQLRGFYLPALVEFEHGAELDGLLMQDAHARFEQIIKERLE